VIDKLVLR